MIRPSLLSGLLLAGLFLPACNSGSAPASGSSTAQSSGNHPPVVRQASILPKPVLLSGPLSVYVEAEDADRNPLTFRYQWLLKGDALIGQTNPTLPPEVLHRGDQVSVRVTPHDGTTEGAPYHTPSVTIGNTPPIIRDVGFEPRRGQAGEPLKVKVDGFDPDQDEIKYTFRWWKNNVMLKETEEGVLDTRGFIPKDMIVVEVLPFDGRDKGKLFRSDPFVMGNNAPAIVSVPTSPTGRERYEYLVQAKDQDGDPVTYQLETAPPGMTIDKSTGHITWPIPSDLQGTHHVRVIVEDGQGGSAFQEFDLNVAAPPKTAEQTAPARS